MLEILAGPFDLLDLDGNPVASNLLFEKTRYYDDDVGLMFSEGNSFRESWVIQLDGTACIRGDSYGIFVLDLQRDTEKGYLLIDAQLRDKLHLYNKRTATRISLLLSGGINAMANIQVRARDRFLSAINNLVKIQPLDISAAPVTEATLTGVGSLAGVSSPYPVWSRTRNPDTLALAYQNGNIVYYNHVTKAQVPGSAFIGANIDAWYSPKHDIWIRLMSDQKLYIHASKPCPFAISTPFGTASMRGRVTTFSVQVTGDAGEPCQDELIDWSLQAGSVGHLKGTQSRTDANGQASIDYLAPVVGSLGDATIQAELKF